MPTHTLPPRFRTEPITIDLVGAGGNGSQMLTGLARLNIALRGLGHPHGLHVRLIDPDLVSASNIGRQLFSPADIGLPKASVLVNRVNLFFGLRWEAHCMKYEGMRKTEAEFIIGCVDTAAARRSIHTAVVQKWDCYWLDLGNEEQTGQVVLGRWVKTASTDRNKRVLARMQIDGGGLDAAVPEGMTRAELRAAKAQRLPLITELYPHLLDKTRVEANTPSCSLAESLGRQDLFINQGVATFALNLLWRLFREGTIDHHGAYINMAQARVVPMPIDPAQWKRLTKIKVRRQRPAKKAKRRTVATSKRGTHAAKRRPANK